MIIGYARVSTLSQNMNMQIDALKKEGCEKIFTDVISGSKPKRPGLNKVLEELKEGDVLMVWQLDRLSRSFTHLVQTLAYFYEKKINLISLKEHIDTTCVFGKLILHFSCAMNEFERGNIQQRTKAGLEAARARGRLGGRRQKLDTRQIKRIIEMYDDKKNTVEEICRIYNISRPSFYNYLNKQKLIESQKQTSNC